MRRITGDASLRFHHLRHSLANYLLLSFHGVEVPWAMPSQHAALWKKVTDGPSRTGLYFIAQVMGHASPDVTLRSYLHFTCLLIAHYCHSRPALVEVEDRQHSIAQLEPLAEVLNIKPATLRKWKERFGDRPPYWLGKAYPQCTIVDLAQQKVVPYPSLPARLLPEPQGLLQLSLEQVEAALEALHLYDVDDVERIFNLREGEAEGLASCARRVLTAPTRQGASVFRHYRVTAGKTLGSGKAGFPRLPLPHSLSERQVAYAMYRAIWSQWFEHHPSQLRKNLRFFYRYHRATDGHVWIRDVDSGLAFVAWVLSLNADIKANIEVIPSARSTLPSKQQAREWKRRLPSHQHKVEWRVKAAGSRYASPLGTGSVKFYVANPNRRTQSGYPTRYVLVMACIVMATLAAHSRSPDVHGGPEAG